MEKVRIVLKKDLPEEFLSIWSGNLNSFNAPDNIGKKGFKTWIRSEDLPDLIEGQPIHPEDNKYHVNFPGDYYEQYDPVDEAIKGFLKGSIILLAGIIAFGVGSLIVALIFQLVDPNNW